MTHWKSRNGVKARQPAPHKAKALGGAGRAERGAAGKWAALDAVLQVGRTAGYHNASRVDAKEPATVQTETQGPARSTAPPPTRRSTRRTHPRTQHLQGFSAQPRRCFAGRKRTPRASITAGPRAPGGQREAARRRRRARRVARRDQGAQAQGAPPQIGPCPFDAREPPTQKMRDR